MNARSVRRPWGEARSSHATAADESHQDDRDGDNQQNMDEAAHRVGRDQPQEPQDDQDDGDRIKHVGYPFGCCILADGERDHRREEKRGGRANRPVLQAPPPRKRSILLQARNRIGAVPHIQKRSDKLRQDQLQVE